MGIDGYGPTVLRTELLLSAHVYNGLNCNRRPRPLASVLADTVMSAGSVLTESLLNGPADDAIARTNSYLLSNEFFSMFACSLP